METLSKHIEVFRQEAEEHLADIEDAVLDLEQNPGDKESINRLFRAIHTIKGSGAMFGFENISTFSHHLETVLDKVRNDEIQMSPEITDLILLSRDQIKAMLDADDPSSDANEAVCRNILNALTALHSKKPYQLEEQASDMNGFVRGSGSERVFRIRFIPGPDIMASGMDPALILMELRDHGECDVTLNKESVPELMEIDPEKCHFFWDINLTGSTDMSTLREIFIFVEEDSEISIDIIEDDIPKGMGDPLPKLGEILSDRGDVSPGDVEHSLDGRKKIGEILVESGVVSQEKVKSALSEQESIEKFRTRIETSSIRVQSGKLDNLINLIGELVITQARISQVTGIINEFEEIESRKPEFVLEQLKRDLANPLEVLERLTAELRDCGLNMRMLPIGTTFGKFRRLVRDLSSELGKEVELITRGGETELDKTVIEKLNDPLVHVVRNSIDHGIESPRERIQKGKNRKGKIVLQAAHTGGQVHISIEDDGRGLDPEVIYAKAVEKGLVPKNVELEDSDIYSLVFKPGFSTADRLTSVSGRGVGMDVVKRDIDALGGSVHISSEKGTGTKIRLAIPLTLAIINGLLVKIENRRFVLPLEHVEECDELRVESMKKTHGRNMIKIRDELVPFIRLRDTFGYSGTCSEVEQIAVVRVENRRVGLVVDEILGNIQTIIKSLDKLYRNVEGISGATILGDGNVVLILDSPGIIRKAKADEIRNIRKKFLE